MVSLRWLDINSSFKFSEPLIVLFGGYIPFWDQELETSNT